MTLVANDNLHDVKAILFDLDGTLIDTLDMIKASMRFATAQVLGEALPDEVLMRNVGVPLIVQLGEFDADHAEEMLHVYREHNASVHDEMVKEYPGVETALTRLSDLGYPMGIVTSKSAAVAQRGLDRFDLGRFFEVVVTYDDVPVHKPDPYPLLFAAQRLGVDIARCAYVGDSPHDMSAARDAGCVAIAALWGVSSAERILGPGPAFAVSSMADVVELFAGAADPYRI